jgi:Transposase DNA-binding/Transposase DDE domain
MSEREDAWEDFGQAELGDARRTQRLVAMAATAHRRPAGRVLQVFETSAERQGAYDFLANAAIESKALTQALGASTARRCAEHPFIFVSVDGSSLSLTDHTGKKGFGRVGSTRYGGRGLKVITALAIDPDGTPIGVIDQQWWSRRSGKKRHDCHARSVSEKETQHWLECTRESKRRLAHDAKRTRIWFLLDRESDRRHSLEELRDSGETYVVRSSYNRRLQAEDTRYLLDELHAVAPMHDYILDVTAGPRRSARKAHIIVRTTRVRIRLRNRQNRGYQPFDVTVVEAREEGSTPPGEAPITWRLLTNHEVATAEDADRVIDAYAQRWSIESFHKTWKTGACNVEDSQLRDKEHVLKWATLLAAVAARIERLKVLSRNQPELPADRELNRFELAALIALKRRNKRRTEIIPDSVPTLGQAIYWLAELGGYTGKSSGGPPGSITIRRGLDYIAPAAALLESLEREGKMR